MRERDSSKQLRAFSFFYQYNALQNKSCQYNLLKMNILTAKVTIKAKKWPIILALISMSQKSFLNHVQEIIWRMKEPFWLG